MQTTEPRRRLSGEALARANGDLTRPVRFADSEMAMRAPRAGLRRQLGRLFAEASVDTGDKLAIPTRRVARSRFKRTGTALALRTAPDSEDLIS